MVMQQCAVCEGEGQVAGRRCSKCKGTGEVKGKSTELFTNVPAALLRAVIAVVAAEVLCQLFYAALLPFPPTAFVLVSVGAAAFVATFLTASHASKLAVIKWAAVAYLAFVALSLTNEAAQAIRELRAERAAERAAKSTQPKRDNPPSGETTVTPKETTVTPDTEKPATEKSEALPATVQQEIQQAYGAMGHAIDERNPEGYLKYVSKRFSGNQDGRDATYDDFAQEVQQSFLKTSNKFKDPQARIERIELHGPDAATAYTVQIDFNDASGSTSLFKTEDNCVKEEGGWKLSGRKLSL